LLAFFIDGVTLFYRAIGPGFGALVWR